MKEYDFGENDSLRFDHGKFERDSCLYASEKVLIAKRIERMRDMSEEFDCSRAYAEFVNSYVDRVRDYLVSFVPHKCEGNVCSGVLDRTNIDSSHVFCHTDIDSPNCKLNIQDLYVSKGIFYRKDRRE